MRKIFFPGITEPQRNFLDAVGLEPTQLRVNGLDGIVLAEKWEHAALTLLNRQLIELCGTEFDSIQFARTRPVDPPLISDIPDQRYALLVGPSFKSSDVYRAIATLAVAIPLNTPVTLRRTPSGIYMKEPIESPGYHIVLGGSPSNATPTGPLAGPIFGKYLKRTERLKINDPRGTQVFDYGGLEVVRIVGRTIYVLLTLSDDDHIDAFRVFRECLDHAVAALSFARPEFLIWRERRKQSELASNLNDFVLFYSTNRELESRTRAEQLQQAEQEVIQARSALAAAERKLAARRLEVRRFADDVSGNSPEELLEEARSISRIEGVRDWEIEKTTGTLIVYTHPLICTNVDDGTQALVGRYTMRIPRGTLNPDELVIIGEYPRNPTYGPQGSFHPHIGPNGLVCWREALTQMSQALAMNDRYQVVLLLMHTLQTCNHPLDAWPRVPSGMRKAIS